MASRAVSRLWVAGRLLRPASWLKRAPAANPKRILVLHHLLLGDSLMLAPLLAKLRTQHPEAEICFACPRALLPLFAAQPYGVRAIGFDPRDPATLKALAVRGGYDLCIIPSENRYSLLARALEARRIIGFDGDRPAWKNWFLDEARAFPDKPGCFGDFTAASLLPGAAPAPFQPGDWPWGEVPEYPRPQQPYAVLHLGASSPLKYWPAERWRTLARWLREKNIGVIWSTGAKETQLVEQADPERSHTSLAGKLDLLQLADLLRHAALLICPDTGVAHLGRLTGTPTVTLFGPGSPAICGAGEFWRNNPYIALAAAVPCRNQTVTFRRHADWIQRCARTFGPGVNQCANPVCMEQIGLADVQQACLRLLPKTDQG